MRGEASSTEPGHPEAPNGPTVPVDPISGADFLRELAGIISPRSDAEVREFIRQVQGDD